MSTPPPLPLTVTNNTGSYANSDVYVYVIGLDSGGDWAHLTIDGDFRPIALHDNNPVTGYVDWALPLASSGATTFQLPFISSGQVYFSFGEKLKMSVVPSTSQPNGLGWTAPSGWTPSDPNYGILYADVELTYSSQGMNCDTTYVDMFAVPITLQLIGSQGTQNVGGLTTSRAAVFDAFAQGGDALASLIVGNNLRVLNPQHAIGVTSFPADYLDAAIAAAWSNYLSNQTLTVNLNGTQYLGAVNPNRYNLVFQPGAIAQPSTLEVFACNGVFVPADNPDLAAIAAVVAAALNRGTLLVANQPDCNAAQFYQSASNPYAQLLHQFSPGGQCYAFPYDDVCNLYSSDIADPAPTQWNVSLDAF